MKTLTLLRHAKSAWDDSAARDFDRPLNDKGRRAARAMGREMREQELAFDHVVASPAVRVTETLSELSASYGRPLSASLDKRVYLASASALIDIIHDIDDRARRLLIVGHNPGLETLALLLAQDDGSAFRTELAVKYPTGTLVEINLPVSRWGDVAEGVGSIAKLIRPRDLDPTLGPDGDAG